ncbi:MAG TPA: two-component regulator propeller domain-containing protein [Paludibacter sp.]|nr:two-component regulator propeller domain-containing protein [Paludibacter sp.]
MSIKYRFSIYLLIACWCAGQFATAQSDGYREFDNVYLNSDASVINCFIQDKQGLIWMGSDKGLFCYNGYTMQRHLFPFTENKNPSNTRINCGILLDSNHLCLGSDNGILIYNLETDSYEKSPVVFPSDVRSLVLAGDRLWIGSLNGLYQYNIKTRQLNTISSGIPNHTIYSILRSKQNTLFVGTYNGLCYLSPGATRFQKIELPVQSFKNSLLVNSLLEDPIRNCIWVGAEGYLFKYIPQTKSVERIGEFTGNSIKSLALDQNQNLLLGTDNGLYLYNKEQHLLKHIVHDSRYGKSLTNNIVWSILVDREKNAWFGTDYGVSLFRYNKTYRYTPISQITGIGDGNQMQSIFRDSRHNFWYGGNNGLIFTSPDSKTCIWYRMGDARYPISHNRIRCIYEDKDHNLWVATDGSINRYDYRTRQFIHYNIVDSTRTRNANWAYQLFEDKQGRLWIASCLGGIFVVDKAKLIKTTSGFYVAEQNFYKKTGKNGLSDNFINSVLPDLQGNVWALTYNSGINKINTKTGVVSKFPVFSDSQSQTNGNANCLICDKEGFIWVGFFGGLTRINPRTNQMQFIQYDGFKNTRINLLTEENNRIWITTSDGTFALDKKTLKIQYIKVANKPFTSSFYDAFRREIYLGGVDGLVVFSPSIINEKNTNPALVLTALYVNDRLFQPGLDYEGKSIRFAGELALPYNQNNVTLEFSDLSFSQEEDNKYVYQLKGVDTEWRTVKPSSNRISYNNLAPGTYKLTIGRLNPEGITPLSSLDFQLVIHPPWYYSVWAQVLYAILIFGFLIWILNYYREKHRTKIERIEKEKSLELSNMKIDFFTNVSHEFKTPLSLIIAPVSKLLIETKNPLLKKQLTTIQQNALRLNALIQQVIGFERFDGSVDTNLIYSQVEFIEFARGIFSVYEEAFQAKNLTSSFISEPDTALVSIDVLKMESVLNNLISNACKFSNQGGTITLEIQRSEDNDKLLIVRITDNGIGIPAEDLPFVFDRFFQSRKTANDKVGSGIGLYLVKNQVELHHGTIRITSEENKGTSITLELPVLENQTMLSSSVNINPETDAGLHNDKPTILIVEDNIEVSEFIFESLKHKYRCLVAHNGKIGLDEAIKNTPDLIIADVMMPVMNGLDMCSLLRKNKDLALVPIIMLTAKDDKLTEKKSIELGINAFMSKPFDTNLLMLRIQQLIGTKQRMEDNLRLEVLSTPKEIEAESWDEKWLANITKIIEDKVADTDLSVNALSEKSGISTKQIYRKIKQLTGLTPVDYIRSIRMKKAAMLLAQKKFSVAEVMYLVGFSNYSYFSKCFHAKYGKTPKQFME